MATDIRMALKKFIPHLLKAREENLNEAQTAQGLVKMFQDVFGYDMLSEISREMQVKGKFVDISLKIEGVVRLLIEVKDAATVLRDRHIDQAKGYAAEGNIRWVLLTNGVDWILFHLTFEEGIEYVKVFTVDLAGPDIDKAADQLGLLHRQSIKRGELEDYWLQHAALTPAAIGKALFHEDVLRRLRRELRKNEDILIDEEDLANAVHSMFTPEVREQIGPMKIRRKRSPKPAKAEDKVPEAQAPVQPPTTEAPTKPD